MARTSRSVDFPLSVSPNAHGSLPEQIAAQVRDLVGSGVLMPGQTLPSSRSIAVRLGASRGTVVTAFEQLAAEGYLESEQGSGTAVSPGLARLPRPVRNSGAGGPAGDGARFRGDGGGPSRWGGRRNVARLRGDVSERARGGTGSAAAAVRDGVAAGTDAQSGVTPVIDLRPGASQGIALPTPQWRAAWRDAAAKAGIGERFEPLGSHTLRGAISERLRRVRAVAADPAAMVITTGARDALHLVLTALRETAEASGQGSRGTGMAGRPLRIAFESPGYPSLRRVPALTGDVVVPAPVDSQGVDPEQLPGDIDALVVTPSHQYPTGASLPVERRLALLALARDRGFLVIEDEHTAEWRWSGAPLPALAGLDDEQRPVVAMLGSLSSLIHPGIAVGFALLPPSLVPGVSEVRSALPGSVNSVAQAALADFIGSGALDRHLQSARSVNRKRLALLREALSGCDTLELQPVPGGLQAMVLLEKTAVSEGVLLERAVANGVMATGLSEYWQGSSDIGAGGVALGFGMPDDQLRQGLRWLVAAADSVP